MAENAEKKGCGYVGRVPNSGVAVIKAPNQVTEKKKPIVHKGDDLRSGK
jgi:hypothetical protein